MRNAAVRSNLLVPEIREVMDIRQASDYLGISPDTLYKYASDNFVPAFKLGNRWKFKKTILDQWMEQKSTMNMSGAKKKPKAAKAAQEANLRYAEIQLDRERKLYAAGVVPKADVDNAQTAFDAAVAQLKALSEQVNQQIIKYALIIQRLVCRAHYEGGVHPGKTVAGAPSRLARAVGERVQRIAQRNKRGAVVLETGKVQNRLALRATQIFDARHRTIIRLRRQQSVAKQRRP